MHDVTLRTAVVADLDALRDVYRRSALSNDGDRELLLAHPEHLEFGGGHVADGRTRVVEADGVIVGFATTVPLGSVLELEDLFVDPAWMRRGIARRLVADALESARALGCSVVEVTANPHADDFYRAVGFTGETPVATELGGGVRLLLGVR